MPTLGAFTFHVWQGPPYVLTRKHLFRRNWAGLDGQIVLDVGAWGDTFSVRTVTFYETWDEALAGRAGMDAAKGLAPMTLTLQSEVTGYKFMVEDVEAVAMPGKSSVGGDTTTYEARVEAMWRLFAVVNPA